jgi:hypothetical protein
MENGGKWMKWAKYKLAAYFAYHHKQELPRPPWPTTDKPGILLCGLAGRFCRKMIRDNPEFAHTLSDSDSFLASILQSKKGFPRPSASDISTAVQDTVDSLTTYTAPIEKVRVDHVGFLFEDLKQHCREVVRQTFHGHSLETDDILAASMPSKSANNSVSRGEFGTLGYLINEGLLKPAPLTHPVALTELIQTKVGQDKVFRLMVHSVNRARMIRLSNLGESDPNLHSADQLLSEEGMTNGLYPARLYRMDNYDELRQHYTTLYFDAAKRAVKEVPRVVAVGLPEALKVRVISKGPPLTYFCLKPLQKFMWRVLKDHPTFKLIGEVVTPEILQETLGSKLAAGFKFLSGDYKAATDNIRGELTECVWHEICNICKIPENLRLLGLRALTQHVFVDPATGEDLMQKSGQLMGSIISFPILCLINAAVCRAAMTLTDYREERYTNIRNLPLLINGDDCALVVSELGKRVWSKIALMAGLEESIGKVYFSDKFVNINSTNFVVKQEFLASSSFERKETDYKMIPSWSYEFSFEETPYVNLGLLYGLKRSGEREGVLEFDTDIGARHHELFRIAKGCVEEERLHKAFLRENRESLQFFRENDIPWYVPASYGGVGMKEISKGHAMSYLDRSIVAAQILNWYPSAPHAVAIREKPLIKLHFWAEQLLKASGVDMSTAWTLDTKTPDVMELGPIYLWLLLQAPQLAISSEADDMHELLRRNTEVWRYFQSKKPDELPRPFDDLLPRKRIHSSAILYGRG